MKINNVSTFAQAMCMRSAPMSGFNEEFYLTHKDKYSFSIIENADLSNSIIDKVVSGELYSFNIPDYIVGMFDGNVGNAIRNDVLSRECYYTVKHTYDKYPVKRYRCFVVLDIADDRLRSKCKLLGIATKLVMHLEMNLDPLEDPDHDECPHITNFNLHNLGAMDVRSFKEEFFSKLSKSYALA